MFEIRLQILKGRNRDLAGIVDQNVDMAVMAGNGVEHSRDAVPIRNVAGHGKYFTARALQYQLGPHYFVLVTDADGYPALELCEFAGQSEAEATGTARDQNDLIGEPFSARPRLRRTQKEPRRRSHAVPAPIATAAFLVWLVMTT